LVSQPLLDRLAAAVGVGQLLTAAADTAPYLTDWRGRYRGAALAVVRPASAGEVAAVLRACHEAAVPVVPQGGNTGLVGGATPGADGRAVVVSLARLSRIRDLDVANGTLTAEAGCTLAAVRAAAAAAGRLFPLSLAAEGSCTIGGNLATNAGGVQVLRYGNARALCLGIEVVLPDGRLWNGLRGLRKDNSGLDLKQLFIGAEGTLGIITAAVLRLVALPSARATAWLRVPSVAAAVDLLGRLQQRFPERVDSYELISQATLALTVAQVPGCSDPLPASTSDWIVLIELADGGDERQLAEALQSVLAEALADGLLVDAAVAASESQRRAFWHLRESAPEAEKRAGFSIKHDIALPLSAIADFVEVTSAQLAREYPGSRLVCFGHLGDGNLHYNLSHPDPDFLDRQDEVNRRVFSAVSARGGSIAAEHGVGQLRRLQLPAYRSETELALMRSVKQALDPRGLMNPGKLYPPAGGGA
jgi:FAD/FMN-containing dehydrogenase